MSKKREPNSTASSVRPKTAARDFFDRVHLRRWLMIAGAALLVAVAASPNLLGRVPTYKIGEFNVGNYRAPFPISIVDEEATVQARSKAIADTPPIYDYNPTVFDKIEARLTKAFADMNALFAPLAELETKKLTKKERAERAIAIDLEIKKALIAYRPGFREKIGLTLSDAEFESLARSQFDRRFAGAMVRMLREVYADHITFDLDDIRGVIETDDGAQAGQIQLKVRGKEELESLDTLEHVVSPKQAESAIEDMAAEFFKTLPVEVRPVLRRIATAQIKPNLSLDARATAEAQRRVADNVVPVTIAFERNELVIGDGAKVTRPIALVFENVRQKTATADWAPAFFGTWLVAFVTLVLAFWLTDINIRGFVIADRDAMLMGLLVVATVFLLRLTSWFDERLANLFSNKPQDLLFFLFPLAAPAMLVRFLTRFEISMIFAVVLTFFSFLVSDMPPISLPLVFLVMLIGVHTMAQATRRGQVLRGGLWVGLATAAQGLIVAFLGQDFSLNALVVVPAAGMLAGIFSGVLVLGLAPLFEFAFGYMTNISLLELANYEQPLLKRISKYTPGTFHHSIAISSLAEAAAEAIGANRLLVRVGAMYHDLGKSLNANFFVENQHGDNPHDRIKDPVESARIVIAHVVDGAKLAREHRLPQDIIDFIEQHHGTRTVAYFLDRARKLAAETAGRVDEELFRYPGPKPQTKETAILMICDVIEARSRTLPERTPAVVLEMIENMIGQLVDEGQFDQSPLTYADFAKIKQALTDSVRGMQHERIAYPDQLREKPVGLFSRG